MNAKGSAVLERINTHAHPVVGGTVIGVAEQPLSVLQKEPGMANADALVLTSYDRFLAALRGTLPLPDYVREVAANVERQLPERRTALSSR